MAVLTEGGIMFNVEGFILCRLAFLKRLRVPMAVLVASLLTACGGGGGGNDEAPSPSTGSIRGVVFAPNGTDPIAQAVVYIPSSATGALSAISATAAATCEIPGVQVVTKTCAGADGAFVLNGVPAGVGVTVVIAKGLFKKEIKVNVTAGAPSVLVAADTTLPIATGPGTQTPRIAVVTGQFDRMEDVLAKLGLGTVDASGALVPGTEKFMLIDGTLSLDDVAYPNFDALLGSLDELKKFDLIMINCGTEYENLLSAPSVVARLRQYVSDGGRLYVTDLSYDFIEQPFPEYIDFFGADLIAETSSENIDQAEVGDSGITSVADILVSTLQSWLGATVLCGSASISSNTASCLDTNGKVHIEDFGGGWAMMETAHPAQTNAVTVWTRGPVSWSSGSGSGAKPLTMTFPSGAGKVLYSSYHTAGASHPYMLPQERILQYLIFEIVQ